MGLNPFLPGLLASRARFYDFTSVSLKPLLKFWWLRNFWLCWDIGQIWHIGNISHHLCGLITLMLFLLPPQEVQGVFVKRANSSLMGRESLWTLASSLCRIMVPTCLPRCRTSPLLMKLDTTSAHLWVLLLPICAFLLRTCAPYTRGLRDLFPCTCYLFYSMTLGSNAPLENQSFKTKKSEATSSCMLAPHQETSWTTTSSPAAASAILVPFYKERETIVLSVGFFSFFSSCRAREIVSSWRCCCVFAESGQPICGNGLVEAGEDCDCGYSDQCADPCCYNANEAEGKRCKLQPGKICRSVMTFCKIPSSKILVPVWFESFGFWFVMVMLQSQPRAMLHKGMHV